MPGWLGEATLDEQYREPRPRTMLQAVTFADESDDHLEKVRLRAVDESEDHW